MKLYFAAIVIFLSCSPEESSEDSAPVIPVAEKGEDGKDGSGCSIESVPSVGYRIFCDDGSEGIVTNGSDGKDGEAGRNGTSGGSRTLPKMFVCSHDENHLSITHEKKLDKILTDHVGLGHEYDVIGNKCLEESACECDKCPEESFAIDIKFRHR